jgi:hypothetical protein
MLAVWLDNHRPILPSCFTESGDRLPHPNRRQFESEARNNMSGHIFDTMLRRALAFAVLAALAATAAAGEDKEWKSLFDGKTLGKWEVIAKHSFKDHGSVEVKDGMIVLDEGRPATGIRWTGEFPRVNYELTLDAKRIKGSDFFCGMTFPVGKSPCTLILGGWGGTVVGLSNINNGSAVENETTRFRDFKRDQWYAIRLRVTDEKIEVWIDKEQIIDLKTQGKKLSIWWEQEPALPLGIVTWVTKGAVRNIRVRPIDPKDVPSEKDEGKAKEASSG